jgi:hypothetical protein
MATTNDGEYPWYLRAVLIAAVLVALFVVVVDVLQILGAL